jgi:hypothetical protein
VVTEEKSALESEWLSWAIDVDPDPVESLEVLIGVNPN